MGVRDSRLGRSSAQALPRLPGGHLTAPCTWLHFCTAPAFSIPVQPAGFLLQAARAGSGAGRMRFLCLHDVEAPRPAADIWQGAGSRASPRGHRGTPGAGQGHSSLAAWCRRGQGRTLRPRCWVQGGRELPEPCSQTFPCPPPLRVLRVPVLSLWAPCVTAAPRAAGWVRGALVGWGRSGAVPHGAAAPGAPHSPRHGQGHGSSSGAHHPC